MIDTLLPMLRTRRMARRDAAQARLARARAHLEAIQAEVRRCEGVLREALTTLQSVQHGQGKAADPLWRQALLPSCEAVVERERAASLQALAAVEPARQQYAEARNILQQRERAILRTAELEQLQRAAELQAEAAAEESVDEDLAAAWRPAEVAVAVATEVGPSALTGRMGP